MSSTEHAQLHLEHLHYVSCGVLLSGVSTRGSLFLSGTWSVLKTWRKKKDATIPSPSVQTHLLLLKFHLDF